MLLSTLFVIILLSACSTNGDSKDPVSTRPPDTTSNFVIDGTPVAQVPDITKIVDNQCAVDLDSYMDYESYRDAVECALPAFPWPTQRTPDAGRIAGLADPDGTYQGGYAYSTLTGLNTCIWEGYWLDSTRTGDQASADLATRILRTVIPNYELVVPNYPAESGTGPEREEYFLTLAQNAELGNVSYVQGDYDLNCVFITPSLWSTS